MVGWLLPFVLVYAHLVLTPLPWQWVQGDAKPTGTLRGLLLALAFNAAWIGALLLVVYLLHPVPSAPPGWPPDLPRPPMGPRMPNPMLGLGMINLAFATSIGWGLAGREAMEARELETTALLREAESKALRNQLEPHVLYNALSSLSELIYEDPLAAEDVITQLADLYRRLTVHGKHGLVNLGEERLLVEAYLAMEQMRLGDRLRTSWSWPEWADGIPIPPFFLQSLVENAIKHGIGPFDGGGAVRISCQRVGTRIGLKVENTGSALKADANAGIGLSNLQTRLTLWSGADGTLTLTCDAGWTVADLQWSAGGAC